MCNHNTHIHPEYSTATVPFHVIIYTNHIIALLKFTINIYILTIYVIINHKSKGDLFHV